MAFRLTETTHLWRASAITASGTAPVGNGGRLVHTDSEAECASFTHCVWWFCEEPYEEGVERVIFEYYNSTSHTHSVSVAMSGGSYFFRWRVGTTPTVVAEAEYQGMQGPIEGKVVQIFASFKKEGTFANSTSQLNFVIGREAAGQPPAVYGNSGTPATGITSITVLAAAGVAHGAYLAIGTGHSARGVAIVATVNYVIRDTEATTPNTIALIDQPHGVFLHAPTGVILAHNHAGGAGLVGSTSTDNRLGQPVTSRVFSQIDKGNTSSLRNYFFRNAIATPTITGTFFSVSPYTYSGQTPRLADFNPSDSVVDSAVARPLVVGDIPFGTLGENLKEIGKVWGGASPTKRIVLGVTANSRTAYNTRNPNLIQYAGTPGAITYSYVSPQRQSFDGYSTSGVYSQANFWPHIVGNVCVPPSGYPGLSATLEASPSTTNSEAAATASREPHFGFACDPAGVGMPLCTDASDTPISATGNLGVRTATTRLIDTSVSRLWMHSFMAAISGITSQATSRMFGAGGCRLLFPQHSYRLMCQPEHTLPVTEPLEISVYLLNVPSSSGILSVDRVIGPDQGGTADSTDSWLGPFPTMGSAMTPKTVTAQAGSFSYNANDEPTARATITVDDSDDGMAPYDVGDLIELLLADGTPPLSGNNGGSSGGGTQARPDICWIHTITGKGTATCVITLDRPFRNTITTSSSKIKCIEAESVLKKITVPFAANEAAAGKWRGVKLRSNGTAGTSGIIMASWQCENPSRKGIITAPYGWPGVGYRSQYSRLRGVTKASDGLNHMQRVTQFVGWNTILISQANQGMPSGGWLPILTPWHDTLKGLGIDVAFAQGGQSPQADNNGVWPADNTEASSHCIFRHLAEEKDTPMLSWFGHPDGVEVMARGVCADDASQDVVHPTSAKEWFIWGSQLLELAGSNRAARGRGRGSLGWARGRW